MLTGSTKTKGESAKQRALRIPLRYTRSWDGVWTFKFWFSLLAVIAVGVYCGVMFYGGLSLREDLSPGRVILAHQSFEKDCDKCHIPGVPLGGASTHLVSQTMGIENAGHLAADQKCKECHQQDGGEHHAMANLDHQLNCAACHKEHLGANHDAKLSLDQNCTHCHANLVEHAPKTSLKNVTAFWTEGGHPEFRSLAKDEGRIRFDHALHLLPGQRPTGKLGGKKLGEIPEDLRGFYKEGPSGFVELDCNSCHQSAVHSGTGARAMGGESMAPIRYDRHCAACHEIGYDFKERDFAATPSKKMPHGLDAKAMQETLMGAIADDSVDKKDGEAKRDPSSPIPGKSIGRNLAQELSKDWPQRLQNAKAQVSNSCIKCHDVGTRNDEALAEVIKRTDDKGKAIPFIPSQWLRYGRFDHAKHVDPERPNCALCHSVPTAVVTKADPLALAPFGDQPAPMMPTRAVCIECHSKTPKDPNPPTPTTPNHVARFDCAECHTFHERKDIKVSEDLAQWLKSLPQVAEGAK